MKKPNKNPKIPQKSLEKNPPNNPQKTPKNLQKPKSFLHHLGLIEGHITQHEDVHDHTDSPHVCFLGVVGPAHQDLRGRVATRAAVGAGQVVRVDLALDEAEVADLDLFGWGRGRGGGRRGEKKRGGRKREEEEGEGVEREKGEGEGREREEEKGEGKGEEKRKRSKLVWKDRSKNG